MEVDRVFHRGLNRPPTFIELIWSLKVYFRRDL